MRHGDGLGKATRVDGIKKNFPRLRGFWGQCIKDVGIGGSRLHKGRLYEGLVGYKL